MHRCSNGVYVIAAVTHAFFKEYYTVYHISQTQYISLHIVVSDRCQQPWWDFVVIWLLINFMFHIGFGWLDLNFPYPGHFVEYQDQAFWSVLIQFYCLLKKNVKNSWLLWSWPILVPTGLVGSRDICMASLYLLHKGWLKIYEDAMTCVSYEAIELYSHGLYTKIYQV